MRIWIGLLLLFGLIAAVTHLGDIEHFIELMQKAEPQWLALALLLQLATYFSIAALWKRALLLGGMHIPLRSLVPLGLAKLFSNQAVPTGGMSGTAFLVAALHRRGVSANLWHGDLAGQPGRLLLRLSVLHGHQRGAAMDVSCNAALDRSSGTGVRASGGGHSRRCNLFQSHGKRPLPGMVSRIPGLKPMLQVLSQTSGELVHDRTLLIVATALHGFVFLLDSLTLWVMLQAIGQSVSFWVVVPSFISVGRPNPHRR